MRCVLRRFLVRVLGHPPLPGERPARHAQQAPDGCGDDDQNRPPGHEIRLPTVASLETLDPAGTEWYPPREGQYPPTGVTVNSVAMTR